MLFTLHCILYPGYTRTRGMGCRHLRLHLLGLLRQNLLANLLLLHKESTHDALAHALVASGSAIGARHGLLSLLAVLEAPAVHVLNLSERRARFQLG